MSILPQFTKDSQRIATPYLSVETLKKGVEKLEKDVRGFFQASSVNSSSLTEGKYAQSIEEKPFSFARNSGGRKDTQKQFADLVSTASNAFKESVGSYLPTAIGDYLYSENTNSYKVDAKKINNYQRKAIKELIREFSEKY
jgi:hypothetical protein